MADKNAEVLVCDASIMKNVWEIRLREYGQKLKLELERTEKSALGRINEDWAKRMSGKAKPRRVERKAKPPEESPVQTFKPKQMALGRPSGFVSSRPQKAADLKKDVTKRNKLNLLLGLNEKQPGLMIWTKSWKFSQALLQSEQMPSASDWGQPWKLLNLQPNNEGKPWMEHEHNTNIIDNGVLFQWEKIDKTLNSWNLEEDMSNPDWKKSWKYTKQMRETSGGEQKNLRQQNIDMLHQSHSYNEEMSSSEWNESWKSSKPSEEDHIKFASEPVSKEENENNMDQEEQSTVPWGQSWKHFKKQLHMKSKSMTPPGWVDSWRLSKPAPQISQQEKISNVCEPQLNMPEEPLDPNAYRTIMEVSKDEKYKTMWSSQFQENNIPQPVNEWQKSWMTMKNLAEYKEQHMGKLQEELPKQPIERQETKKVGSSGLPVKSNEFELFPFPPRRKPAEMLEPSEQKDKETFLLKWKDSWKTLKNQRRQDRIRSRQPRTPAPPQAATPQTSLTEWANSWRFTNLNANQNNDLWQQGWSTYTHNRPDRWVQENEARGNEGFPRNGPTGARGWGESWRSTRHQHRVEREATHSTCPSTQPVASQTPKREPSLPGWEQSWQVSSDESHHDRPFGPEWADSWRFCSFQGKNWAEGHSNHQEKLVLFGTRKELRCPSHRFSTSFEPQTFKQRFPPQEWKNSWKLRSDSKKQPKLRVPQESWLDSWMLNSAQLYKSTSTESSNIHMANLAQYESISEWGSLWKIANPQPPKSVASWFEAKPNTCNPEHMVFWKQYKSYKDLLSLLTKDYAKLKMWGKAWRFMKLESRIDMKAAISQSKPQDDSVIMSKRIKPKKQMYSQLDKEAPQVKRWVDACKLAKTQPRPKRDARSKPSQGTDEGDKAMFTGWVESWRFVSDSKSDEPVKISVSLTEWEDSWKFLLNPYAPQNGPKKTKAR